MQRFRRFKCLCLIREVACRETPNPSILLPDFLIMFTTLLSSLFLLPFVSAAAIDKRGITGPVITSNFPDPSFVKGLDGAWYAFSTNSGGKNVPVANSADFVTWTLTGQDALPTVGAWSTGTNVWAPDVIRRVSLEPLSL